MDQFSLSTVLLLYLLPLVYLRVDSEYLSEPVRNLIKFE